MALSSRIKRSGNQVPDKSPTLRLARKVPTAVPPISVYAIEPQKTENVRGMNASTAARAVRITGRDRCTVRRRRDNCQVRPPDLF